MKTLVLLLIHVLTTLAKRVDPGGAKAIIAESVLLKHQQLIARRSVGKTPRLTTLDRFLCGFLVLFMHPSRIRKAAVVLNPATLTKFRSALLSSNYHRLFSSRKTTKPGPKGPTDDLIRVIVEMKQRNAGFGCPRIAQEINKAFGVDIDKDVVRRVLEKHYRPGPGSGHGPSWLTFIGHQKDSLWSIDLFRCESILLNTHWVLVVMDPFTRRIIGFGVHAGYVDGVALCRMFNKAISTKSVPKHLSSDNDPLFLYHQWQANLRILGVDEIKTVPYTPLSHPFIERLIGTIRRELLDHTLFWNAADLERKLAHLQASQPTPHP